MSENVLENIIKKKIEKVDNIKKSIILVTHDIDEAIFLSDKVIIMGSGKNNFRFQKDISMPHPRSSNINMSSEFLEIRKDLYCRLEEVR